MSTIVPRLTPGAIGPSSSVRRTVKGRARRILLGIFFASVVVNAAIGIYAVLTPGFGDTARRILLTSLCVTGALLMALCCEPAWERRLLRQVPAAGAMLGAAAFAGLIVGIWTEPSSTTLRNLLWSTFAVAFACVLASLVVLERARKGISVIHERVVTFALVFVGVAAAVAVAAIWAEPSPDTLGKLTGTGWVVTVACVLAAFLTLARLAPSHRWVLGGALALLGLGTVFIVLEIWLPAVWGLTRAMGVVLIVLAAFVVTVPVMHWLDRGVVAASAASGDAVKFCPHCGARLAGEVGVELDCSRCGRGFTVSPARQSEVNLT